jgi:hypothetical protein
MGAYGNESEVLTTQPQIFENMSIMKKVVSYPESTTWKR